MVLSADVGACGFRSRQILLQGGSTALMVYVSWFVGLLHFAALLGCVWSMHPNLTIATVYTPYVTPRSMAYLLAWLLSVCWFV